MSLPAAFLTGPGSAAGTAGKIIGGMAGFIPLLISVFVRTILEGEKGMRTRNGKPISYRKDKVLKDGTSVKAGDIKVLKPGTYLACPIIYAIRVVDVKIQGIDLPVRTIEDANGIQYIVQASLEWRRGGTGADLRRSELGVANELEVVTNRVANSLMDVIRDNHAPNLPSSDVISERVVAACSQTILEECGLEVLRIRLTGLARTSAQVIQQGMLAQADKLNGGDSRNGSYRPLPQPVWMSE